MNTLIWIYKEIIVTLGGIPVILYIKENRIYTLMSIYRYGSLSVTSLVFILQNNIHNLLKNVFIITSIIITGVIFDYMYRKINNTHYITILLLIEIIGNSVILIPSGGLASPYIWYSINTLFISAINLGSVYLWGNLVVYFIAIIYIPHIFLPERLDVQYSSQESNLILSFILVTGIVQILAKYSKGIECRSNIIEETNAKLQAANNEIKQSMNHIIELYKTIHHLSMQDNKDNLIQLITEYSIRILGVERVHILTIESSDHRHFMENFNEILDVQCSNDVNNPVSNLWNRLSISSEPIQTEIQNKVFILSSIRNDYKVFGLLVIDITSQNSIEDEYQFNNKLKFITDLGVIVLEKKELEQVNELLLINEEQNRIANEIHDGVLQKLFSISCGLFNLSQRANQEGLEANVLVDELNLIRKTMNDTMKDLRSTIYGLSWKKYGDNNFINLINTYIDDIKALHDINIIFEHRGHIENLDYNYKKSIYRIICEGIGNAIRHGRAEKIEVNLFITNEYTTLRIVDNGCGFDKRILENSKNVGLGMDNMNHLTLSINGRFDFISEIGKGTAITIKIPNQYKDLNMEAVV